MKVPSRIGETVTSRVRERTLSITIVTSNPLKVAEITPILSELGIGVRWKRQSLPEIQSRSLRTVVRWKLSVVPESVGDILVEDSGLFVTSLRGFPGVYSSYIARTIGVSGLLRLLRGRRRQAEFRTAVGIRVREKTYIHVSRIRGEVATWPRGRCGYLLDRLFVPSGSRRTLGEISLHERGELSQRRLAVKLFAKDLARDAQASPVVSSQRLRAGYRGE